MPIESLAVDAQLDFVERLLADEFLANVPVLDERIADIESEVDQALATVTPRNAKAGACIIVLEPLGNDDFPNLGFGPLNIDVTFLVLEDPTINRNATVGTLKKAWEIARRIRDVMKHYIATGYLSALIPLKPTIVPVENPKAPRAFEVRFGAREADTNTSLKVLDPQISPASGAAPQTVTLTCATSGAAIYYTLDGTHPRSGNPTATLYSVPFLVSTPKTLRVGAYKTGSIASNIARAIYT